MSVLLDGFKSWIGSLLISKDGVKKSIGLDMSLSSSDGQKRSSDATGQFKMVCKPEGSSNDMKMSLGAPRHALMRLVR